jgi:hypothetical protein
MINGYLFRLRLDIDGYAWMQQITVKICKRLEHGILYGYKCISKMEISLEYTWICKVECGYEYLP